MSHNDIIYSTVIDQEKRGREEIGIDNNDCRIGLSLLLCSAGRESEGEDEERSKILIYNARLQGIMCARGWMVYRLRGYEG